MEAVVASSKEGGVQGSRSGLPAARKQGRRDGGRKISRSNISSLSAAAPCEAVPPCECTNRREVELSS